MKTRRPMPDSLTMVDSNNGTNTITATQEREYFILQSRESGTGIIEVWLTEQQARRLYGRLSKYFREIK